VDTNRRLLSTWTGKVRPDGHMEHQEFAGDYSEAFRPELSHDISEELAASQAGVVEKLGQILDSAQSPAGSANAWGTGTARLASSIAYARAWQTDDHSTR